MVKRKVCLHFHIFKNGGTTLEWVLKKNFSKHAVSIDMDYHKGILTNKVLVDYLRKNPNVKSISSHQIRFPLPEMPEFQFVPILFLRDPIDRAFSIYYFQRKRIDADRPGIIKAKELTLNDYIKWNMKTDKFMPMKNFQVLFLSHHSVTDEVNNQDLKVAIENAKSCPVLGLVDSFDESLVLAEEVLKEHFPKIDLSYFPQNISKERLGISLEEKINKEKFKLEESVYNSLLKHNALDRELYGQIKSEFKKRLNNIDDLDAKLTDLKMRCKKMNKFLTNLKNRIGL